MSRFDEIAKQAKKELKGANRKRPITVGEFYNIPDGMGTMRRSDRPKYVPQLKPEVGDAVRAMRDFSNISCAKVSAEGTLDKCEQLTAYLRDAGQRKIMEDLIAKARRAVRTDHRKPRNAQERAALKERFKKRTEVIALRKENERLRKEKEYFEDLARAAELASNEEE